MSDITNLRLRMETSSYFELQAASVGHTRAGTAEIEDL